MISDVANSEQEHTPGNLKQTHVRNPPHLVLHVPTVPCKKLAIISMAIYSTASNMNYSQSHKVQCCIKWISSNVNTDKLMLKDCS